MEAYEKLDVFYLGRHYDPQERSVDDEALLYRSRDLTTHAVIIGMTGSGKTGLGVGLLEEAALDGVPALIVDPKGDMGNLLLTFPKLRPENFEPWMDANAAARKGKSTRDMAVQTAKLWREGLAQWGQGGDRIQRLKDSAEFAIYTPGSRAGRPLSILASFSAPSAALLEDRDLFETRIETTVTSLLGLLEMDADPITSQEHIFLSNLFAQSWERGEDLELASLIAQVQNPPFQKLGVMDLDSVFPEKARFALARRINNLVASPGFAAWMEGDPLDVGSLLYTKEGKPRHVVLSIAHLGDAEREFFLGLLLGEVIAWMRQQSGTGSLRALLYIDEIFGLMPPTANPATKKPLLTLLKQARAFGLGLVLATQNPVDLDYKGLSNCGTWFLGRLQTERDRDRVMDGLMKSDEGGFDRRELSTMLSSMAKRVFLLHNINAKEPQLFHTRWVMSYLKGPLTRQDISRLTSASSLTVPTPLPRLGAETRPILAHARSEPTSVLGGSLNRTVLPPGIDEFFIHGGEGNYRPVLLGAAEVKFIDKKNRQEYERVLLLAAPIPPQGLPVSWDEADRLEERMDDLSTGPEEGFAFGDLPPAATKKGSYRSWRKQFSDTLYSEERIEVLYSPRLDLTAEPGEEEGRFRVRLRESVREARDKAIDKLRQDYGRKEERMRDRLLTARQRLEKQEEQLSGRKRDTFIQAGASILGSLFGGRRRLTGSRIGSVFRQAGRISGEKGDVARAEEKLEELEGDLRELEEELEKAIDEVDYLWQADALELDKRILQPRRADVRVKLVALGWIR